MKNRSTKPTVLKRKSRYSGRAFSVYEYRILVDGKKFARDIIEQKHGVVVVPIDAKGNVLLLSEYCAGSNSYILSLPGGKIDKRNANVAAEAQRELREETGYRARELIKLRYAWSHPSTSNRRSYVFLALELVHAPLEKGADEILQVITMPLGEAIRAVTADFKSDVSTIGNLLMAQAKLNEIGRSSD